MHFALIPEPSAAVTVITALPAVIAVISPVLLTDATEASEDWYVTVLSEALSGATAAVMLCDAPILKTLMWHSAL